MILVFGTVCLDRLHLVQNIPPKGGYVEISSNLIALGGEAANTALLLKQWRAEFELHSHAIGQGRESDLVRQKLYEKNLNCQETIQDRYPVAICDIYVTPDGQRTMFGQGFAELDNRVSLVNLNNNYSWVTTDPNLENTSLNQLNSAQKRGVPIYVLDHNPETITLKKGDFWQSSTDRFGTQGDIHANLVWIESLIEMNEGFWILSDGPNGFIAGGDGLPARHYAPFPCPKLIDSTGAGDIFRGAMLYGLQQGWDICKCLTYASVTGCLHCQHFGANETIPSLHDVESHLKKHSEVARTYNS